MKRNGLEVEKEFNIDNYQYVEETVDFSTWLRSYRPEPNKFLHDARLSGLLYEHDGEQWEHVMMQTVNYIWTVFEEDGQIKMRNGYQVRGRIGYVLCNNMHNAHGTIFVTGLSREMVDHVISEDEH